MAREIPEPTPGRPFLTILRYNRPYWRAYAGGLALSLFFVGLGMLMPPLIGHVVGDLARGSFTLSRLWLYISGLLLIAVGSGLARYGQRMLMIRASRKFEYDVRNDYFYRVQRLSQDFFHEKRTGDIMARATNDLNQVRSFIGPGLMSTIDLLSVPFTIGIMAWYSGRLTAISLAPYPIVSIFVYMILIRTHRISKRVQEQFADLNGRVHENLAGARVVKAYGAADREMRDFERDSTGYFRESMRLTVVSSLIRPLMMLMGSTTVLLVLWRGGTMVVNGVFTLESLTTFMFYQMRLMWPLAEFGFTMTLYQRGAVAMNRISEILARKPAIADNEHTRHDIETVEGHVRFDHVSFAYYTTPVLEDVSFEVPTGKTLAIMGPTGSGKSSVVSLLTREYDPTSGNIHIDGQDGRRLPLHVLRGAIGYVPQDTFLFSDTVRTNLKFGRPDATDEEMCRACKVAQFAEVVEQLPNGYDTLLGERGVNLSGGQKQRLTIARALVCDPKILILDDALSSVDTQTEDRILAGLKEVMAQRTTLIISHRVNTVRDADEIIVIDEGRIVEQGVHEQLLSNGQLYAAIFERQQLEEEMAQYEEGGGA